MIAAATTVSLLLIDRLLVPEQKVDEEIIDLLNIKADQDIKEPPTLSFAEELRVGAHMKSEKAV